MYSYIKGIICEIHQDHVIIDNQGIGYHIFVAHPEDFRHDTDVKIYVYSQIKEDSNSLFGFLHKEEKELFLRLIDVTGIGPKTAIAMLSATTYSTLVQAIETGNTSYLKKLPGIGPKASQQIILDLKGKLVTIEKDSKQDINQALEDAKDALKKLGFRNSDIDRVAAKIGHEMHTSEEYLRMALTLIKKG